MLLPPSRFRFLLLSLCLPPSSLAAEPPALTIRDTIGIDWREEPICWELELPAGGWRGGAVRVEREGSAIPAQAMVVKRHGDGSARLVEVRFIIDRLPRDGSTALSCRLGEEGPRSTDLGIAREAGALVLSNAHAAVRLPDRKSGEDAGGGFSPILGVRTVSGKWTGPGYYGTGITRPSGSKTELLEEGPIRLSARVTTTFENGRSHAVTVTLLTGSRSIDLDESFDVGPDDRYRFREYGTDRDELGWEWWSWYGDVDGTGEDHPNNWFLPLGSADFRPVAVRYRGENSTDSDKGETRDRGESGYTLRYSRPRRLEKYLAGHGQWRPDAVTWYAASPSAEPAAEVLAAFTHSAGKWANPNVYPSSAITLRTGANDIRIISFAEGNRLVAQCPIGLGRRVWSLRSSTVEESFGPQGQSPTALSAEIVKRNLGLDVTRKWITEWEQTAEYPRLFIDPKERAAYFARLKDAGVGTPGIGIDTFLRRQHGESFERFYREIAERADRMIAGYFSTGLDNTNGYPGWMLGYWHAIDVACGLDNLLGSPLCSPREARELRKKLAILTYCLTSRDAWPDKRINYGWGSMNMPVGRWGGLVVMASAIGDHPRAGEWLKDARRYYRMLLSTEYAPDGTHISCPHYIGASSTSFYAWIALARSGLGDDVSTSPVLKNFARYYLQLMTPIDPRFGIRTLLTEGDTRPGSSPFPGLLATLFRRSDPELAGQLMQVWIEGGRDAGLGLGVPDLLIIDPTVPPRPPRLAPEVFPGFGAVLRYRKLATPEEAYLSFLAGNFMADHVNADQLAFSWYEKGVPLSLYQGDMYVPGAVSALSHNALCWSFRPEGDPTPGKGFPGDWYHDHGLPWVEHARRPRLHLQVASDPATQKLTDSRGHVTLAADGPGAAILEGRVEVRALAEVPTRSDWSTALQQHSRPPLEVLERPFAWTRRILYVKDAAAAGMNYLVVRDDTGDFEKHLPSFSYWSLSEAVDLGPSSAHFRGQLGVDTDLFVAHPPSPKLFRDEFTHDQCEPIISGIVQSAGRPAFREKQVLARIEGERGRGFLVVIFPRKAGEPPPQVTPWLEGKGAQVTWKGETHQVVLDVLPRQFEDAGIRGEASCLVVKRTGSGGDATVCLPAGGTVEALGKNLSAPGPAEWVITGGEVSRREAADLLRRQ
jgi:hypothetical protein